MLFSIKRGTALRPTKLFTTFLLLTLSILISSNSYAKSTGEKIFKVCLACHGSKGEGIYKLKAPAIAGLPVWYMQNQLIKFSNGGRGKHPDDIEGMRMRPMGRALITETHGQSKINDVSKYVSELKPQVQKSLVMGGNVEAGKNHYMVCMACHGPDANGMEALKAPSLKNTNDWYLLSQLKKFKAGVRGYSAEKDPEGMSMAPMAQTLADEQAMKDVIAYIKSLK